MFCWFFFFLQIANSVKFTTTPSLSRHQETLLLVGCQYTSTRNQNLREFGFYKHGAREIPIDTETVPDHRRKRRAAATTEAPTTSVPSTLITFQLPSIPLIESEVGDYSCGIRIGGETFYSDTVLLGRLTR